MFKDPRDYKTSADHEELVAAFLAVRRAIGLLGLILPILLYASARVLPVAEMQPSISEFYHTVMGDILVGILVTIGVFLIAYVGHMPKPGEWLTDWSVSTLAGLAIICVAIFPAAPEYVSFQEPFDREHFQGITLHWNDSWYWIHYFSAAVFFVCMAVFCLLLFPRNKNGEIEYFNEPGNLTYLTCGSILIVSIVGLLVYLLLGDSDPGRALRRWNYVFWFETIGVIAFAVAWLTKGNFIGVTGLMKRKKGPGQER